MFHNEDGNNDESTPILLGDAKYKEHKSMLSTETHFSPEKIYRNFSLMCLSFSLNHACIVASLSYASAELGDQLGSMCAGILYVTFALTAFLISNPIVSAIGPRYGMLVGVSGYCLYICGFLFTLMALPYSTELAWFIACGSAGIGGLAGGVLWISQGRYVTLHASLYAQSTGSDLEKCNSDFAALFAAYFLYLEMSAKLFATIVYVIAPKEAPYLVFSLYTMIAIATCFIVAGLHDMNDYGTWEFSYKAISRDVGAAGRLVYEDRRLVLIIPYQIAFGFTSSMIVYYVMGTVIAQSPHLGKAYVGFLAAIIVLSGAITSIPLGRLANEMGKSVVMFIGNLCMIVVALLFFVASNEVLGTWLVIIPYLMIFGVARGVWENVNRASIADMFGAQSSECTTAYSATGFFTGYASALGYFTFYAVERSTMAGVVLFLSLVSIICYQVAFVLNKQLKEKKDFDSHRKEIVRQRFYEYAKARELPPQGEKVFTGSMVGASAPEGTLIKDAVTKLKAKSDDLL